MVFIKGLQRSAPSEPQAREVPTMQIPGLTQSERSRLQGNLLPSPHATQNAFHAPGLVEVKVARSAARSFSASVQRNRKELMNDLQYEELIDFYLKMANDEMKPSGWNEDHDYYLLRCINVTDNFTLQLALRKNGIDARHRLPLSNDGPGSTPAHQEKALRPKPSHASRMESPGRESAPPVHQQPHTGCDTRPRPRKAHDSNLGPYVEMLTHSVENGLEDFRKLVKELDPTNTQLQPEFDTADDRVTELVNADGVQAKDNTFTLVQLHRILSQRSLALEYYALGQKETGVSILDRRVAALDKNKSPRHRTKLESFFKQFDPNYQDKQSKDWVLQWQNKYDTWCQHIRSRPDVSLRTDPRLDTNTDVNRARKRHVSKEPPSLNKRLRSSPVSILSTTSLESDSNLTTPNEKEVFIHRGDSLIAYNGIRDASTRMSYQELGVQKDQQHAFPAQAYAQPPTTDESARHHPICTNTSTNYHPNEFANTVPNQPVASAQAADFVDQDSLRGRLQFDDPMGSQEFYDTYLPFANDYSGVDNKNAFSGMHNEFFLAADYQPLFA
ncbi:MAG: hypothetical protein Q9166_008074 [cf. Caloplaca sp. 2 TL-2023]